MGMRITGYFEEANNNEVFVGTEDNLPPTIFQLLNMKILSKTFYLTASYNYSSVFLYEAKHLENGVIVPQKNNTYNGNIELEVPFGGFELVNNDWLNEMGYDKAWASNVIDPYWLLYYSTRTINIRIKRYDGKNDKNFDKDLVINYGWRQKDEVNVFDIKKILNILKVHGNQITIGYNSETDEYRVFWTYITNPDYDEYVLKRCARIKECFNLGYDDFKTYQKESYKEQIRKAKEEQIRKVKEEERRRKEKLEKLHRKGIYIGHERDKEIVFRQRKTEKYLISIGYNPYTDYTSDDPRWCKNPEYCRNYSSSRIFDAIKEAGYEVVTDILEESDYSW